MATFDGLFIQTGLLGDPSIQTTVPEGWFLDDSGASVTDVSWAPIDILTLLVGLTAATIDLRSGHTNFSLNNLLACLIATDILQVGLHCLLRHGSCNYKQVIPGLSDSLPCLILAHYSHQLVFAAPQSNVLSPVHAAYQA